MGTSDVEEDLVSTTEEPEKAKIKHRCSLGLMMSTVVHVKALMLNSVLNRMGCLIELRKLFL